jgi:hypothetical protein
VLNIVLDFFFILLCFLVKLCDSTVTVAEATSLTLLLLLKFVGPLATISATKNEIVSHILSKFELGNIMAHCLTVMHKIDARVGNNAVNRFTSYMNVFPCTLSLPHVARWDTVLVDHPLAAQDMASIQQAIWHFIAVHATNKDYHELLDICSIAKPCKMDVQTYTSCLHELNHQVDWLPGTDLPLTEDQLHQAFFDGMPTIWKEQYENAGHSVHNTTYADLLRVFVCNKRLWFVARELMKTSSSAE